MKVILTALAGFVGFWLGWYCGASLGYSLWPKREWVGAVFSYFVGAPIGALSASLLLHRMLTRSHNK